MVEPLFLAIPPKPTVTAKKFYPRYAIVYGDRSGVIALFESLAITKEMFPAFVTRQDRPSRPEIIDLDTGLEVKVP